MEQTPGENIMDDIDFILNQPQYEKSLFGALKEYAVWRYFTGSRAESGSLKSYFPTSKVKDNNTYPTGNADFKTMSGMGGVNFIVFTSTKDILNIYMNGNDQVLWDAVYIRDNGYNNYSTETFVLNNSGNGSSDVIIRDVNKIVLIPICLTPGKNNGTGYYSANQPPKRATIFTNSYQQNNLGGQLLFNNSDNIISGEMRIVSYNTYPVKTKNERFFNGGILKHNNWNGISGNFLLSNNFTVQAEGNVDQDANFDVLQPAIIRNIIDGMSFNDQLPVWFNDPWYVTDQYGNQLGMGNYITPPPLSPYHPTGAYNQSSGGVFLDQGWPNWQPPYYSVKAEAVQDVQLSQTGRTHKFYFQGWSANPQGSAEFQDAGALQTPVVFRQQNATVQANFKGTQLSNNANAFNYNNQRKYARTEDGYLHLVYESMGSVWYEISPDNGTTWYIQNNGKPISLVGKQPSLDFSKSTNQFGEIQQIVIVWQEKSGINSVIKMAYFDRLYETPYNKMNWRDTKQMGYVWGAYETTNCTPVVALSYNIYRVVYKNGNSGSLLSRYDMINPNTGVIGVYGNPTTLIGTNNYSVNPSIAVNKNSGTTVLVWEQIQNDEYSSIKYDIFESGSQLSGNIVTISTNSGSPLNFSPSVSFANNAPVVSWTGGRNPGDGIDKRKAIITRGTSWGSFQIVGNDVNFVNNNSAAGNTERTVISWSEGTVNPVTKWIKREEGLYTTPHLLSNNGIHSQVSSGANFQTMSAMVFNNTSMPYYFLKSTTDFSVYYDDDNQNGLNKITESDTIVTWGRSGVASINEIEFVFEIGDILVGDSVIKFIQIPDTLIYTSSAELNQHTRTENFTLTPNTNFFFSNIYYVVQKSNPDSALALSDSVNFRVELVNSSTNQVVGIFDNVTYNKNNLEKYANIDYSVDCSGITAGEYYLRLVTNVNGNAKYSLANIFNNNTTFAKKNYSQVNFIGKEIPITYDLLQNFPNPFNPSTTIRYQIPTEEYVTIKVYDILGAEVATLVNETKIAGNYEVNFDASNLSSGVYIYKLTAGSFSSSRKMMVIK